MTRPGAFMACVVGLALAGCAALAGLPDWQMAEGAADAASDGGIEAGTGWVDGGGASADGGRDASGGCPFGCPQVAFDFDEGAGPVAHDRSAHGNDGTLLNGTAWGAGVAGGALAFDGVNDILDVASSASVDVTGAELSILFWANVDDSKSGGDHVLVDKAWATNAMAEPFYQYGVEFSANGNKSFDLFFAVGAGTRRGPYSMKPPGTGVWTHVAFTYDGAKVKGYLDGVEKLSVAVSGRIPSRPTALRLGVDGASAQPYKGLLDDVRIYDRALSAAEISTLRDAH